jgi:hypothetical protein
MKQGDSDTMTDTHSPDSVSGRPDSAGPAPIAPQAAAPRPRRCVSACPWGPLRSMTYCDKMPSGFQCDSRWCWDMGVIALEKCSIEFIVEHGREMNHMRFAGTIQEFSRLLDAFIASRAAPA